jgi:hypothetical protein
MRLSGFFPDFFWFITAERRIPLQHEITPCDPIKNIKNIILNQVAPSLTVIPDDKLAFITLFPHCSLRSSRFHVKMSPVPEFTRNKRN